MCDGCKKAEAVHKVKNLQGQTKRYCPVCFLILGRLHEEVLQLDGEGLIPDGK